MWLKKLLVCGAALGGVLLASGEAKADYLCSVQYYPGSTSLGSEGFVFVNTTSAVNCGGTLVNIVYFCTTGASSSACPANASYRYERHGILALFQALQRASAVDQNVTLTTVTCNQTPGTSCGAYATFRAD